MSFLRRIVGSLFPKEQVPASIPPTPREAGTTLTAIVAFPCVGTNHRRKFCGLLQVQHWAAGQWDDLAIERSLSVTYYGEEGVGLSVIALKGIEGEPLIISFR